MFDISWSELMLIGVVALVVIGPKELPGVLRSIGQMMRKVRGMAAEFQSQFQEAMREAEMADLKKQVDDMAQDFKSFDPLKDVRSDVENLGRDLETSLNKSDIPASEAAAAPVTTPAEAAPALPEPVAAPAADYPLPQATAELADQDTAGAGIAPAAPDPKPETGGRAA